MPVRALPPGDGSAADGCLYLAFDYPIYPIEQARDQLAAPGQIAPIEAAHRRQHDEHQRANCHCYTCYPTVVTAATAGTSAAACTDRSGGRMNGGGLEARERRRLGSGCGNNSSGTASREARPQQPNSTVVPSENVSTRSMAPIPPIGEERREGRIEGRGKALCCVEKASGKEEEEFPPLSAGPPPQWQQRPAAGATQGHHNSGQTHPSAMLLPQQPNYYQPYYFRQPNSAQLPPQTESNDGATSHPIAGRVAVGREMVAQSGVEGKNEKAGVAHAEASEEANRRVMRCSSDNNNCNAHLPPFPALLLPQDYQAPFEERREDWRRESRDFLGRSPTTAAKAPTMFVPAHSGTSSGNNNISYKEHGIAIVPPMSVNCAAPNYAAAVSGRPNAGHRNRVDAIPTPPRPLRQLNFGPVAMESPPQIPLPPHPHQAAMYPGYRTTAAPLSPLLPSLRDVNGSSNNAHLHGYINGAGPMAGHSACSSSNNYDAGATTTTTSQQLGMKELPGWLKSLRLHKYTANFQSMSYAEMMALDDVKLEQKYQITKGARRKILQSIEKLHERVSLLKQLELSIDERGDIHCLVYELRSMMSTPMCYAPTQAGNADGDLPDHICRVLSRLQWYLFESSGSERGASASPSANSQQPATLALEEEYVVKLIQVCDKCLQNESAFPSAEKRGAIQAFKLALRRLAQERGIGGISGEAVPRRLNGGSGAGVSTSGVASTNPGGYIRRNASSSSSYGADSNGGVRAAQMYGRNGSRYYSGRAVPQNQHVHQHHNLLQRQQQQQQQLRRGDASLAYTVDAAQNRYPTQQPYEGMGRFDQNAHHLHQLASTRRQPLADLFHPGKFYPLMNGHYQMTSPPMSSKQPLPHSMMAAGNMREMMTPPSPPASTSTSSGCGAGGPSNSCSSSNLAGLTSPMSAHASSAMSPPASEITNCCLFQFPDSGVAKSGRSPPALESASRLWFPEPNAVAVTPVPSIPPPPGFTISPPPSSHPMQPCAHDRRGSETNIAGTDEALCSMNSRKELLVECMKTYFPQIARELDATAMKLCAEHQQPADQPAVGNIPQAPRAIMTATASTQTLTPCTAADRNSHQQQPTLYSSFPAFTAPIHSNNVNNIGSAAVSSPPRTAGAETNTTASARIEPIGHIWPPLMPVERSEETTRRATPSTMGNDILQRSAFHSQKGSGFLDAWAFSTPSTTNSATAMPSAMKLSRAGSPLLYPFEEFTMNSIFGKPSVANGPSATHLNQAASSLPRNGQKAARVDELSGFLSSLLIASSSSTQQAKAAPTLQELFPQQQTTSVWPLFPLGVYGGIGGLVLGGSDDGRQEATGSEHHRGGRADVLQRGLRGSGVASVNSIWGEPALNTVH